jgi:NADH-quinone oxidoreductase subunit L
VSAATASAGLLVLAPLAVALTGLLLPQSARRAAAALATGGATVALAAAVTLAVTVGSGFVTRSWNWVHFGALQVTIGVTADRGMAYVAIAVGVVALAVQVYSVAYLHDDDRYPPYAAQVSLFTAAMLLVVVGSDLVTVLVGWEVMGACSYLLIGHDRSLPEAPAAAVKAFLVTRVGDVGFLLGIALLGLGAGTFRIADVLASLPHQSPTRLTLAGLLLLAGAVGKSAQFPLHTWLPDAMAGPTPISALIHAATMVAAGVIVLVRLGPLFHAAPGLLPVIAVIAAVTMLLGALAATAQEDIKRVLAWSTVSQVAYMFAGFSVGTNATALFHLLTHAAFKALLFLAAGCVIHAVGTNLMSGMGGLRRGMPVTFLAMTAGLAALAGVPPFSGFFSKDAIIDAAWQARDGGQPGVPAWAATLVLVTALATVAVTAWYATRLWLRTFFGDYRGGPAPHEAPGLMRWPVVILAVPATLLGFAGLSTSFVRALDGPGSTAGAFDPVTGVSLVSLLLVAAGATAAAVVWRRDRAADPARALGPLRPAFAAAFGLDAVQHALVVRPFTALAAAARRGDTAIVDGAVEGTGRTATRLGESADIWHHGALPRAAAAVFGGALVIAAAAVVVGGLR